MSKYVIDSSTLVSIGNAVRDKEGTTAPILVSDLADRISAIETGGGGGGYDIPDSAFNITGDCQYKFSGGGWDWFIELYGDKITTNDISNCGYMFRYSNVEKIPFDINIKDNTTGFDFTYMFGDNSNLKELPKINGKLPVPTASYHCHKTDNMFANCYYLKEIPDGFYDFLPDGYKEKKESLKANGSTSTFNRCYSLRKATPDAYMASTNYSTGYYYSLYNSLHGNNFVLDEVVNLPVEPGPYTSNCFSSSFSNCYRLSRVTFETNEDGTPKTANWKGQTITLGGTTTNLVGYAYSTADKNNVIKYGGGVITADKEVNDDATYAALKNDPDWFATRESYSRYNKLSAIETINTLPDCSASGGANTIKFRGVAGGKTDGGAINTMTEAEIAVATAKGWTVSFV